MKGKFWFGIDNVFLRILLIGTALISAIQLVKYYNTSPTSYDYGESVYSEVSVVTDASIVYMDDSSIVLLSPFNTIQFFDWNGNFLYSLSLSPNSKINLTYHEDANEWIGYYYRINEGFRINQNHVISQFDIDLNDIPEESSECYQYDGKEYCFEKTLIGIDRIVSENGSVVLLETNKIYYVLTMIAIIVTLLVEIRTFVVQKLQSALVESEQ